MNARQERETTLNKLLSDLFDREWSRIIKPVLLKRTGLYIAEIDALVEREATGSGAGRLSQERKQRWAVDAVAYALLFVDDTHAPAELIATWSDEQRRQAYDWAMALHMHASDNDDVVVPPRPDFIPHSAA